MIKTFCNRCGTEIKRYIDNYDYPVYMDGPWSIHSKDLLLQEILCYDCQLELHKFLRGKETEPIKED